MMIRLTKSYEYRLSNRYMVSNCRSMYRILSGYAGSIDSWSMVAAQGRDFIWTTLSDLIGLSREPSIEETIPFHLNQNNFCIPRESFHSSQETKDFSLSTPSSCWGQEEVSGEENMKNEEWMHMSLHSSSIVLHPFLLFRRLHRISLNSSMYSRNQWYTRVEPFNMLFCLHGRYRIPSLFNLP